MDELDFNYNVVLYNKLMPALYSKVLEFHRENIDFVREEDIWEFMAQNKWNKKSELSISERVSDIMHANRKEILIWLLCKLKKENRSLKNYSAELL